MPSLHSWYIASDIEVCPHPSTGKKLTRPSVRPLGQRPQVAKRFQKRQWQPPLDLGQQQGEHLPKVPKQSARTLMIRKKPLKHAMITRRKEFYSLSQR